jgi:hypothetical protein
MPESSTSELYGATGLLGLSDMSGNVLHGPGRRNPPGRTLSGLRFAPISPRR